MKAKELRELTTEELLKKEDELKTELYNLRFQSAVGNLEKPSRIKEIRNLTTEEINTKIKETKEELFNLRFQQATGNLEKPSRIRELRHEVARMKTVLRERMSEGDK